jgi:hypothetical protein
MNETIAGVLDQLTNPTDQLLDEARELADDLGVRLVDKDELLEDTDKKNAYDLFVAFEAACRLEEIIDELRTLRGR